MSELILQQLRGGWQIPAGQENQRLQSFAAPGAAAPNIWKQTLPADPRQAHKVLANAEDEQAALLSCLQAIPGELGSLVENQNKGQVSFGIQRSLTPEQQQLLEGLRWLETASRQPISFAAGQPAGKQRQEWAAAWQEFRGLMAQAERLVSRMAWVNTELGNLKIAQTVVGWSGDTRTHWLARVSSAQAQVHQRELALALARRQVLIQVVTLTTQAAAKLSATLSIPGGGLLAIPQVWQYTCRMIALLKKQPANPFSPVSVKE